MPPLNPIKAGEFFKLEIILYELILYDCLMKFIKFLKLVQSLLSDHPGSCLVCMGLNFSFKRHFKRESYYNSQIEKCDQLSGTEIRK